MLSRDIRFLGSVTVLASNGEPFAVGGLMNPYDSHQSVGAMGNRCPFEGEPDDNVKNNVLPYLDMHTAALSPTALLLCLARWLKSWKEQAGILWVMDHDPSLGEVSWSDLQDMLYTRVDFAARDEFRVITTPQLLTECGIVGDAAQADFIQKATGIVFSPNTHPNNIAGLRLDIARAAYRQWRSQQQ